MIRVLLLLLALLGGLGAAQPYAADGGFGRPIMEESRAIAASVSVAVSSRGTVTTVWAGPEGVWRIDRTADGRTEPQLVESTDDVRSVSAGYAGEELFITWVTRDRYTGTYIYRALLDGRKVELFQDALVIDLTLFEWNEQAHAAGLFRRDGEGQVRILSLATGEEEIVYRTSLTQRGLDVLPLPNGELWLGWLEGRNERGEFGLISEWDALVGLLPAKGADMVGPAELGAAYVEDERQAVALASDSAAGASSDAVWALWAEEEEGDLWLTQVIRGEGTLSTREAITGLGHGRPIGGAWPHLYWVEDASVLRVDASSPAPTSVAWSPITLEGADFATARVEEGAEGARSLTAFAWYGRAQGGAIEIYSSDDRAPMEVTLTDRLAALMGWNPWHLWDELLGQLFTALVIGMVGGILLVPLLMVVGSLLNRMFRSQRAAMIGGLLFALAVHAVGTFIYRVAFPTPADARLIGTAFLAALAGGLLLGWLFGRSGDREATGTFTVAGAVGVFAAVSVFSFITYKQWAPLVGLS